MAVRAPQAPTTKNAQLTSYMEKQARGRGTLSERARSALARRPLIGVQAWRLLRFLMGQSPRAEAAVRQGPQWQSASGIARIYYLRTTDALGGTASGTRRRKKGGKARKDGGGGACALYSLLPSWCTAVRRSTLGPWYRPGVVLPPASWMIPVILHAMLPRRAAALSWVRLGRPGQRSAMAQRQCCTRFHRVLAPASASANGVRLQQAHSSQDGQNGQSIGRAAWPGTSANARRQDWTRAVRAELMTVSPVRWAGQARARQA